MTLKLPVGLYDGRHESDACGIGFYANLNNDRSHHIIETSLEMLKRLDHRGGIGADGVTGDGAGIMTELPHDFFRAVVDFELPVEGRYAVGMAFTDGRLFAEHMEEVAVICRRSGLEVLGVRQVPVDTSVIAPHVIETMPVIEQLFVQADKSDFEKELFTARKFIEKYAHENNLQLYFASCSAATIVYKGWLRSDQIKGLYTDLTDERYISKFGSVHSRFSTNTFPSWERAHPNRVLMHNGEINTIHGNAKWMRAREKQLIETIFGEAVDFGHVIDETGSDSSMVDNALEFLSLAMAPEKAAMLMIPEPWQYNDNADPAVRAFYEYYSYMMEPWDGPTMISFCDGKRIGALTDRNGLRPGRYYLTSDNHIIFSSEVGVVDVDEVDIVYKGQLNPGKLLLCDFEQHRIIDNDELKAAIAAEAPFEQWLADKKVLVDQFAYTMDDEEMFKLQQRFGYTREELMKYIVPLVNDKKDPIGAMGFDSPLAVLSETPESLFNYFKQSFAQVTNPPIDSYREKIVTSEISYLGSEGNLIDVSKDNLNRIQLENPIITREMVAQAAELCRTKVISTVYTGELESALNTVIAEAKAAVEDGCELIVLSDEAVEGGFAIPNLLALSAVHQTLTANHTRSRTSLAVISGEAREVHHIACLLSYGANAVVPYVAQHTVYKLAVEGAIAIEPSEAVFLYNRTLSEGVVKVMSKMGISTVQSYQGAQIFEAVGISEAVINRYFTGTISKLSGINLETIDKENKARQSEVLKHLKTGSTFQWRHQGGHHAFNPTTIHLLQHACRDNDYNLFKEYSKQADEARLTHLRNLFDFKTCHPVDIQFVESTDSIVRRFKTGAMSYGSISEEAHQTLAEAMNRIGGRSNSGEGGESPERYDVQNGINLSSAIKQVASGRFGVTNQYLNQAKEIQIKVAQGAKPGEGGQLPGTKVYPWVAEVRGSTPGVGLISPPPHHDIYSIEDLAQLIHDLKNANRQADISVKLVSKSGVGTIASGVAKAYADKIVISGYDGGTGASPKTSIQHAGLPWEIGLAETQQTLMLNGLRSRVTLETDGKLMTGRDVAVACALGAEEFAFATAPLVVLGCIMMRVCHLDTCPVGIATQNGELRSLFTGKADHIVNFMYFIAEELREILAALGLRSVDELVGNTDVLEVSPRAQSHEKAAQLKMELLLVKHEGVSRHEMSQNHHLEQGLDLKELLPAFSQAIAQYIPHEHHSKLRNVQRDVGVIVGSEMTRSGHAFEADMLKLVSTGHAGQSFGAFIPAGLTLCHTGDANDYVGKGLSGGKIMIKAPNEARENNIIAGNVCLYGATSGEVYLNGSAGERFCVRNSGAHVVVEGIGDHGLEYMTGGRVIILGDIGKNFAAGMSGGVCYIFSDKDQTAKMNHEMILLERLENAEEIEMVKSMLERHVQYTNSTKADALLKNFDSASVVKVIPKDFKLMRQKIALAEQQFSKEDALLTAFMDDAKEVDVKLLKMHAVY